MNDFIFFLILLIALCNNASQAFLPTTTTTARSSSYYSSSTLLSSTPEPLASEGGWTAYLDDVNTGLVYYFNAESGESVWAPPTDTFPAISLTNDQQVIATNLQKKYQIEKTTTTTTSQQQTTATTKKEEASESSSSLFGTLFASSSTTKEEKIEEPAVVEQKEEKEDDSSLFGNLFAKKEVTAAAATTATAEPESSTETKKEETTGGFPFSSLFGKDEKKASPATTTTNIMELDMSAYVLPHPAKVRWGGEDAVFCKGRTFGVFDGVSGAEKLDGIPLYSVTLAQEMKELVGADDVLNTQQLTQQLTIAAENADRSATGASTAVVASMSKEGELQILNVGDSSCFVLRNNAIVAKTKEIVHYFDCPYQLSEDSPDRPRDGTKSRVRCQAGDIIVMGSDGVFDNLSDENLLEQVTKFGSQRAAILARKVVEASRRISLDDQADTPYAKMAKRNGDEEYADGVGGKVDDVSCIIVKCT